MYLEQVLRGKNNAWRYLLGTFAVISAFFVGQIPFGIYMVFLRSTNPEMAEQLQNSALNMTETGINSNLLFFFNLLPFMLAFFVVFFVVKFIHDRSYLSLVSGRNWFGYDKLIIAMILWFVLTIVSELVLYTIFPDNYMLEGVSLSFVWLFIISLLLIPFQAAFEEIFIRGYLMQAFAGLFRNRFVAIVLTAGIFAALHFANPEVKEFGSILFVYYFLFGLVAGIIAVLDNGLEIPIGLHIANNLYGAFIITYSGSVFQTDALFTISETKIEAMMLVWIVIMIVFVGFFARKYQWKNFMKIFKPIDSNQ